MRLYAVVNSLVIEHEDVVLQEAFSNVYIEYVLPNKLTIGLAQSGSHIFPQINVSELTDVFGTPYGNIIEEVMLALSTIIGV